jgi:hypothetical protein
MVEYHEPPPLSPEKSRAITGATLSIPERSIESILEGIKPENPEEGISFLDDNLPTEPDESMRRYNELQSRGIYLRPGGIGDMLRRLKEFQFEFFQNDQSFGYIF